MTNWLFIDFHVPHRTILDEIEYLIDSCISSNTPELHNACITIFKLLYLLNDKFYSKYMLKNNEKIYNILIILIFKLLFRLKWTLGKRYLNEDLNDGTNTLLPSAIVLAASKIVLQEKHCSKKLSKKTNNAVSDIEGIANIILLVILE